MATRPTEKTFETLVLECQPGAPPYCLVPEDVLAAFNASGTFVVNASVNGGVNIGRRSIKPWGDGRWFMEFTKEHCQKAQITVGDRITVTISSAPETPDDLIEALKTSGLLDRWRALTAAQRRVFSEEVFAAKKAQTRVRRIERVSACLKRSGAA